MLNDDHLEQLRTEIFAYLEQYGGPTEPAARDWFVTVLTDGVDPFDAFAPMFDSYSNGLGFTVDDWMRWTYNFSDITIGPSYGGGVYVYFDFEFEDDSGDYAGERGGKGHI